MLILTEKPSVAEDFAKALNCTKNYGLYENINNHIIIVNCIGHLFSLFTPKDYNAKFADWHTLPIIPQNYYYNVNPGVEKQARLVINTLKEHRDDKIIIATDADREGEIIARECLQQAGIYKISNIYRFWVSQALTKEVILSGLKNVKPLTVYNKLAKQGFTRQYADWLVGMNFTRYITSSANKLLPVGRVQTAILSAINDRCNAINNFVSSKYYEIYGLFNQSIDPNTISGIYFTDTSKTKFNNLSILESLNSLKGKKAKLTDKKISEKHNLAPELYNLNALQKEAFRSYGYTAEQTLKIVQSLYEELKCVSYPRTPSRVMGEQNIDMCKSIYNELINIYPQYQSTNKYINISLSNKHCFNDSKLEAHHALIPLKAIPDESSTEQQDIYNLILERFMMAFLPEEQFNFMEFILDIDGYKFKITGKQITNKGWKRKEFNWKNIKVDEQEEQDITKIDFENLYLTKIEPKEKWTIPPKHFNEASILSFMENPKNIEKEVTSKLVGLGTPATRHSFIPKLIKNGYIKIDKRNIVCTELGSLFLDTIKKSNIKEIANIEQTTLWEEQLEINPDKFYNDIVEYIIKGVQDSLHIDTVRFNTGRIICPLCKCEIKKGKNNWYCSGYKEGCTFPSIWETIAGAKISESDVRKLIEGKTTSLKHCTSKAGKKFDCKMKLNQDYKIEFILQKH